MDIFVTVPKLQPLAIKTNKQTKTWNALIVFIVEEQKQPKLSI